MELLSSNKFRARIFNNSWEWSSSKKLSSLGCCRPSTWNNLEGSKTQIKADKKFFNDVMFSSSARAIYRIVSWSFFNRDFEQFCKSKTTWSCEGARDIKVLKTNEASNSPEIWRLMICKHLLLWDLILLLAVFASRRPVTPRIKRIMDF